MKYLMAFALVFRSVFSVAQAYVLPVKELTEEYKKIYVRTNTADNVFSRLDETSNSFLSFASPLLTEAVIKISKPGKKEYASGLQMVFDSVLQTFIQNNLWDEYPAKLELNKEVYTLYNSGICPCITQKINSSPKGFVGANDINECMTSLLSDSSYLNSIRLLNGAKSADDLYEMSKYAMHFLLQKCSRLNSLLTGIIKDKNLPLYFTSIDEELKLLDNSISGTYKKGNFDSLSLLFPGFRKYEPHIKQLISAHNRNQLFQMPVKLIIEPSGIVTIRKTYFLSKEKKDTIAGQVEITAKEYKPSAQVLSFKFLLPDKIPDIKEIEKQMEVRNSIQIPTIGTDVIDVKIDTMQRK